MTRTLALLALLALAACGKTAASPGTSVRVALTYADALGLETADVTLAGAKQSTPIEHELLLLLPDALAGQALAITVVGRAAEQPLAFGQATVSPVVGKITDVAITLAACTPGCDGNNVKTCVGPDLECPTTCRTDGIAAHCEGPPPSNGVDPVITAGLPDLEITGNAIFHTDTGQIEGAITRAADRVDQADAGIYFTRKPAPTGGVALGVFGFGSLTVAPNAKLRFLGPAAVALVVGRNAEIDGTLDVSAGVDAAGINLSAPGPGGGAGATDITPATGCGAGGSGAHGNGGNGGGGGGGAATTGGPGGGAEGGVAGGAPGAMCLQLTADHTLAPLIGGGGGGWGVTQAATGAGLGGGGGGAIQITALGAIVVGARQASAVITASGAQGEHGDTEGTAGTIGGGGGAGAGGAIVLEAASVSIGGNAILAANGGGGGGGAALGVPGMDGAPGGAILTVPSGGGGGANGSAGGGGTGGGISPPDVGNDGAGGSAGGGGGGGGGLILLRGQTVDPGMNRSAPVATVVPIDLQ
jgi:hypothetical protein